MRQQDERGSRCGACKLLCAAGGSPSACCVSRIQHIYVFLKNVSHDLVSSCYISAHCALCCLS